MSFEILSTERGALLQRARTAQYPLTPFRDQQLANGTTWMRAIDQATRQESDALSTRLDGHEQRLASEQATDAEMDARFVSRYAPPTVEEQEAADRLRRDAAADLADQRSDSGKLDRILALIQRLAASVDTR